MRLGIGADHHGAALKAVLRTHLESLGHEVVDFGVDGAEVDYPDIGLVVAQAVAARDVDRAVLICGTGLGMAIVANKVAGVRAASVSDPYSAERAIRSNDAHVLCLGAKVVGPEVAKILLDHWLSGEFGGGDSARKVAKIAAIEVTPSL
jgi:ribose 5-phosphate isomerase B